MAQNLKDLAGRLPSGPRGMGTALKLLLGAGAVAYGVRESVFTGEPPPPALRTPLAPPDPRPCPTESPRSLSPSPHQGLARTPWPGLIRTPLPTVEGGQRAIFFNRIGGVQQDTILAEGLHFR